MALRGSLSMRPAFFVALIAAPLGFAAVGAMLLGVSALLDSDGLNVFGLFFLASVVFGGLSYLVVGGYFFWKAAKKNRKSILKFALTGFIANVVAGLASLVLAGLAYAIFDGGGSPGEWMSLPLIIHAFGLIFAPGYGLLFGWVFLFLAREPSLQASAIEDIETVFR